MRPNMPVVQPNARRRFEKSRRFLRRARNTALVMGATLPLFASTARALPTRPIENPRPLTTQQVRASAMKELREDRVFASKELQMRRQEIMKRTHQAKAPEGILIYVPGAFNMRSIPGRALEKNVIDAFGKRFKVVIIPWNEHTLGRNQVDRGAQQWGAEEVRKVVVDAAKHGEPVYVLAHSAGTKLAFDGLTKAGKVVGKGVVKEIAFMGSTLSANTNLSPLSKLCEKGQFTNYNTPMDFFGLFGTRLLGNAGLSGWGLNAGYKGFNRENDPYVTNKRIQTIDPVFAHDKGMSKQFLSQVFKTR